LFINSISHYFLYFLIFHNYLLKTYEIKKVYDYQKVTHDMERLYLLEKIY